jgi:hypothetical protein
MTNHHLIQFYTTYADETAWLKLNVMVEWLTLMLHIRQAQVQISAQRPAILTDFLWFSSVSPGECWDSPLKLGHNRFLLNSFQFIIHISPFHSMLYSGH